MIEIIDPNSVIIDGVNAGQALDAVRNHPEVAGDIQRALAEWWTVKQTAHAEALTAKETEHAAVLAAKEAAVSEKQALIDAMGGTAIGQQLAKERAIAEAVKAKADAVAAAAEAQKKIDDLNKPVTPKVK